MGYNISVGWETNRNELNLFNSRSLTIRSLLPVFAPGKA